MLAEQDRLKLPQRRMRGARYRSKGDQGKPAAAVTFGFQQVIPCVNRLADRWLSLGVPGRWHGGPAGPHDRIPSLALQPIGLAYPGFRSTTYQDRFFVIGGMYAVRVASASAI